MPILKPLISRNARIAPSSSLQTSTKIHAINLPNLFFHHHLSYSFTIRKFPKYMSNGRHGVIKNHPRPRPAHHAAHPLPHIRPIAMHGAHLASRFRLAKLAAGKPSVSVFQQRSALRTEASVPLLPPTIEPNHRLHHALFFFYPSHVYM